MKKLVLLILLVLSSTVFSQNTFTPSPLLIRGATQIPNSLQSRYVLGWQWGGDIALSQPLGMQYHLGSGLEKYAENLSPSITRKQFNYIYDDNDLSSFYAIAVQFEPTIEGQSFAKHPSDEFRAVSGFETVEGNISDGRLELLTSNFSTTTTVVDNPYLPQNLEYIDFDRLQEKDARLYADGRFWYLTINLRRVDDDSDGNEQVLEVKLPFTLRNGTNGYIYFDSLPNPSSTYSLDYGNGDRGLARNTIKATSLTNSLIITKDMLPKSSDTDQDITISAFFICEYTSGSDPLLNYALKGRTQDNDELKKQKEIVDLGIEVNYTPNCDIAIDYIRLETPRAQMMFRGYSDLNDFTRGCKLLNSDENIFSIEDLDDPFDNKIVDYQENEKIKSFQKILDAVMDRIDGTDENDFFRMYGFEEEGMDHWLANRYLNKIFNNSVCAESNLEFNEYYSFVVEPNFNYYGLPHKNSKISAPYVNPLIWYAGDEDNRKALMGGYTSGYKGRYILSYMDPSKPETTFENNQDTLNSVYETWLQPSKLDPIAKGYIQSETSHWDLMKLLSDPNYQSQTNQSQYTKNMYENSTLRIDMTTDASFQSYWEKELYTTYKKDDIGYFLFEDKNWWANIWISPTYKTQKYRQSNYSPLLAETSLENDKYCLFNLREQRPWTGEEISLKQWSAVLKGAKGLMYDRSWYNNLENQDTSEQQMDLGIAYAPNSKNTTDQFDEKLAAKEDYGGDFIEFDSDGDLSNLNLFTSEAMINTNLQIPSDRFYVGRLSTRMQLKKMHDWINAIEDAHEANSENVSLMDLRLVSYYSKGFRPFTVTNPEVSENILQSFVDLNNIKTRPIGRLIPNTNTPYYENTNIVTDGTYTEAIDSGFYDITLHKQSNVPNIIESNKFFLGVQNRRTDPLLHFTSDGASGMVFLSTAEFDDLVQNGGECYLNGITYTADFWKNQWWKRLGCREINIPIDYKSDNNPNYFSGLYYRIKELGYNNTDLNTAFWRQSDLYHMIDTVIQENEVLSANFLPGQGKLIEVEAKYLATTPDMSDTSCVTCEGINSALEVSIQETNDYCYSVTIMNNSACDFIELNLMFQNERVESDLNYTCNTGYFGKSTPVISF